MAEKNRTHEDFYEAMPATMDTYSLTIDDEDRPHSSWSFLLWLAVPVVLAAIAVAVMSIGSKPPVELKGNAEVRATPVGQTNTSTAGTEELPAVDTAN